MTYRQLGNSEVKITPITFGAWAIGGWLWGGADRQEAERAIEASIEIGITSIDTAAVYGFGLSEEIVGGVLKGKRDRVQILTKYGLRWDTTLGEYHFSSKNNEGIPVQLHKYSGKESIIQECEQSLKRLGTDYIDLYQMHWPDSTTPVEESMEAVDRLIQQGKVLAAGVSNFSVGEMESAGSVIPLASNQVAYSMVRRTIEDEIVPYAIDNNIAILVYSPLQRGILTGKIKQDHVFNSGDNRPDTAYYRKENRKMINDFLDGIRPLADGKNASLAQLVIRWTLQKPGVTSVLAGIRNENQLKDNAGALAFELSDEEMDFIDTRIQKIDLNLGSG